MSFNSKTNEGNDILKIGGGVIVVRSIQLRHSYQLTGTGNGNLKADFLSSQKPLAAS